LNISVVSCLHKLAVFIFADGLYSVENIKTALKEVFSTDRSILNSSYATSIEVKIDVSVIIIQDSSYCMFTNYNNIGSQQQTQGTLIELSMKSRKSNLCTGYHVIQLKDVYNRVSV